MKFSKKIFLILLAVLLTAVSAFSEEKNKITIAVFEAKPLSFKTHEGDIKGIFPDILKRILDEKYELHFNYFTSINDAYNSVLKEYSDLIMPFNRDTEREKHFDFNDISFTTTWSRININRRSSIENILDLKNKRIGIQRKDLNGKNFTEMMKSFSIPYSAVFFDSYEDIIYAIGSGKIDAGVFFNRYPVNNKHVKPSNIIFSPSAKYVACKKDSAKLIPVLKLIDTELRKIKENPESYYYQILEEWTDKHEHQERPLWLSATIIIMIVVLNASILLLIVFRHLIEKTKRELTESQMNYKTIADHTFNWELWYDENHNLKYCSPACEDITGYSPDEFFDNPDLLRNIICENYRPLWDDHIFNSEALYENDFLKNPINFCITAKDGNKKWIEHRCKKIFNNSKHIGYRSSNRDITKRIEAYEELKKSDQRYSSLFYESGSVMFLLDPDTGSILDTNEAAVKFYGYSMEQLKSMNISQINTLPEEEVRLKMKDAVKYKRKFFQFKHRLASGEIRDVQVYSGYVTFGDKHLLYTIIHDITETISTQEELASSESLYKTIFNANLDGIIIFSDDNRIEFVNPTACRLYGYPENEITKMTLFDLVSPKSHSICSDFKQSVGKGREFKGSIICRGKGGKKFYAQIFGNLVTFRGRKLYLCLIHDITERKEYEERLIKEKEKAEESDRLKGAFLANVSHELRTPLNGIMGMHNLLKETSLGQEQLNYLEMAENAANNLFTIIRDLLDLSRIDTHKLKLHYTEFDVIRQFEMLGSLFSDKASKNGIDLVFEHEENELSWIGDKARISQIVMNLISNAIKFSDNGRVLLKVRGGKLLEITVSDEGIGIAPEKIEEIFKPFHQLENPYTKKVQGIGAGLAIVKNITELMAGTIEVTSNQRKGTTFTVKIPPGIKSSADISEHIIDENRNKNFRKKIKTILVAEDDRISLLFIRNILQKHGYDVLEASNGIDAVKIALEKNPDLILMDIGLPKMNGLDAILNIRKNKESGTIPIIAVTAHAHKDDKTRILKSGADEIITKPYDKNYLLKRINKYSGQK